MAEATGAGFVFPEYHRGHAEHVSPGDPALQGHALGAEPDDRCPEPGRTPRLPRLHAAVRRSLPGDPSDARRASGADGPPNGCPVPPDGLAVTGTAGRAG